MSVLSVTNTSEGMAEGSAFVFMPTNIVFEHKEFNDADIEIERIHSAYTEAFEELKILKEKTHKNIGEESAHIFRAQQTIVEDESIREEVIQYIQTDEVCAEVALEVIFSTYKNMFKEIDNNSYNSERVIDIDDVYRRIFRKLITFEEKKLDVLPKNSVVIAEELFPSDTVHMDRNNVVALITEKGGVTSHVSILAKTLGIPAVCGIQNICHYQ